MSGFSLDDFKLLNEGTLDLKNVRGEPSGWVWTFAGPGHPKTVAADERAAKHALHVINEQEKIRVNGKRYKGSDDTLDDVRDRNIGYMIERLLGWSDGMTVDGQPFVCTPENARSILLNPGLGVYEQVNGYLTDEKSFTPRSPKP